MSTRNYEAMFILDNNAATADFEGTSAQVDAILERHGASIVQKDKWDERKLAYEIRGHRRGTYYLTYFTAEPDAIRKINEDVQLNEVILRHLVLTLELPIQEHIDNQADEREKLAEDSRKNSLGGWGGGRRGDRRPAPPRKRESEGEKTEGAKPDGAGSEKQEAAPAAAPQPAEAAAAGEKNES
ncbi:MAG: 30S ribosomal protein S6 [Planctomycetota bacterium]|nr:30S ribosomal protein S6 [Planctomycetota bacterium]